MQKKEESRSGQGTKDAKAKTDSKSVRAVKSPAKKQTETGKSSK